MTTISQKRKNGYLIAIGTLIIAAALSRLIPHPPNFTAVGAMAIFGGAYFTRERWLILVPFLALWLSDLLLNNLVYQAYTDGFTLFSVHSLPVYIAFALVVVLSHLFLQKQSGGRLLATSLTAAVLFFIVTNLGVWLSGEIYPLTMTGLIACFTAAIPFFGNTLLGNLFYTGVLFGAIWLINKQFFTDTTVQA